MKTQSYEIEMVGLGVMGRNLLPNIADHGHSVADYDKDATKVAALRLEAENRDIRGKADFKEFIGLLRRPRAVMMLVPAGAPVDSVCRAAESGAPAPGLMVSLGYLDAYRSAWLPANLIQAQRDYFGAHTYELTDAKGTLHTEWEKESES